MALKSVKSSSKAFKFPADAILEVIIVSCFLSKNFTPSFKSPIIIGIFLLPSVAVSDGRSALGITKTAILVAPAQSTICIGCAGLGCRRYFPSLSFKVSRYCKPSSFVIILEVPLKACPRVTFKAFLMSSIPARSVFSF